MVWRIVAGKKILPLAAHEEAIGCGELFCFEQRSSWQIVQQAGRGQIYAAELLLLDQADIEACTLFRPSETKGAIRQAQPFVFHRQPSQEGGKSGSGWHLPMNLCMPIFRRCWLGSQTPIGDITAACGYQSGGHFAAAFKQQFGFLPSDVRM